MQFYTGLQSVHIFNGVLASLGPAAFKLRYMYATPNVDVGNQLFLTLMKLRTNKTNFELARMFAITELDVCNIFVTWVKFISKQCPETNIVRHFAPSDLKALMI